MQKQMVIRSIAGMLSALFCLPSCSRASENVIDLKDLYNRSEPAQTLQRSNGNFIEMNDATILFFHPSMRQKLRSIINKEVLEYRGTFQSFSTPTKESQLLVLDVREKNGLLEIGKWTVKASELDRLVIAPEWPSIYKFLESLFPGPTKLQSGVITSSIVRLNGSRFLITGGVANVTRSHPTAASAAVGSTATVFDAATGKVVRTFSLCQNRKRHQSLLLPDGRVLLLGGFGMRESIEIVDVEACRSHILPCRLSMNRWCFTPCLDRLGNCILLGDMESRSEKASAMVEKLDLTKETISRLPDLECPRGFIDNDPYYRVYQNAILLPDNSILVSSGLKQMGIPIPGPVWRLDAEIYKYEK